MSKFDKLKSAKQRTATEAYTFKNGKTVKAANAIVPTVLYRVDWQSGSVDIYGSNRNRRDASKVVKFTAVARTDSAVYDAFGRRYLMKACYLTADTRHAVTAEQLPLKQSDTATASASKSTVKHTPEEFAKANAEIRQILHYDIPNKLLKQMATNWAKQPNSNINNWVVMREDFYKRYGKINDKREL